MMAKQDKWEKEQERWLRWVWEPDEQRRDLEAAKIFVKEGRTVGMEEREKLGTDLFTRELSPDRDYSAEKLTKLLNQYPDAAKSAAKNWKILTDEIRKWQEGITERQRAVGVEPETDILIGMFNAMLSNDLVRVRTCMQCGVIFVAYKSNNQFHADVCRKRFHKEVERHQPGFAAKHNAKARERYKEAVDSANKGLELSKTGKPLKVVKPRKKKGRTL